jgi:hypothetical protein
MHGNPAMGGANSNLSETVLFSAKSSLLHGYYFA